ncbi:hypothetical protein A3C91_03970 [Candidatus Azambacteria bacterium RIFCSPHIGHO2_02_FULL_52_12]|uniref:Transcription regulator TrmB N-terminal domain-containing protein n=1 Tax=Candidatus Azambacteria bacterium RIFCSPLOWO2_01_FULL_46_25 TaxID=1797298 RepID=A0A1F5BUU9_9BACT|nr:MAG: hypothetical protein A3C91_03970 [Candidatus Azambacteria bacterium RIFCSPHIGHO2_02_FULL_52_12]OGD34406.1 MAG: hypothetical protein A2988_02665 [Candidatus Azambacteria bacterium RIFCSPLOWO2_01_FULL_46_25]OGD37316.1 MAG: hypothetical protein A2850_01225 [Candidatus Azambacteria bacterium RIFCSPHIGHO2_01_FULL_51_74]
MAELLLKKLIDFGLLDKEARAYLAILKLGLATANEAAKTAEINRSSAYVVLESLRKKGLVGISDDKKIRKYVAASPDTLLYAARAAAEKQEKIRMGIEAVVPELKALHKDIDRKPRVRVYEGKAGLIASLEDSLDCQEKLMRVTSSAKRLAGLLPDYLPEYVKQRVKKGIKSRGIHPADDMALQLMRDFPRFDDSVLIPEKEFKAPADMAIYDNKIAYISPKGGGFSIIIENKELAEVMKTVFDMAWAEAKRLNKDLVKKHKEKGPR